MGEKIIHTEGGGVFRAVEAGDEFARGVLTDAGAAEVNASRAQVAEGLDSSISEKLAANYVASVNRRGSVPAGAVETIVRNITESDKNIYIRRR